MFLNVIVSTGCTVVIFHSYKPTGSPVSCHLAVVGGGGLACLDDPESYTGWGLDPWQVQPSRPGRGVEARPSATPGPPGWGL